MFISKKIFNSEIEKLHREISQIRRILQNSKVGEIGFVSVSEKPQILYGEESVPIHTMIYMDGKEYDIVGLHLFNPKFSRGTNPDVLFIDDHIRLRLSGILDIRYTVNLKDRVFIETFRELREEWKDE